MKFRKIFPVILCCFLISGCWDKVEIDRKAFISTIGIDPGKEIDKAKELKHINPDEPFAERQIKKFNITYGYPDMSQLGPQKSGTADEKTILTEAYSLEDGVAQATSKSSRHIHLGHTELLLLSNEIMMYPEVVKEIIDYFQRHPFLNRMMMVVITEGKAEDYIKFKPDMEKNIEVYLSGLMENSNRNATILPMTVNEMLILLSENGNAIVPKITLDKDKNELSLSGVAVIKNYELKGDLNPVETSDLEIIRGKLKGGKKVVYKEGHPIDYVIEGIERKIKVKKEGKNKLVFNVDIKLEGQIKGYHAEEKVFSVDSLTELEENINKSLGEECEKIVKMTQDELEVEPFGFQEYIEKFKPSLWDEIEENWEEVYKASKVNINVFAKIRRIGVTD